MQVIENFQSGVLCLLKSDIKLHNCQVDNIWNFRGEIILSRYVSELSQRSEPHKSCFLRISSVHVSLSAFVPHGVRRLELHSHRDS